jgi:hypothetical protein
VKELSEVIGRIVSRLAARTEQGFADGPALASGSISNGLNEEKEPAAANHRRQFGGGKRPAADNALRHGDGRRANPAAIGAPTSDDTLGATRGDNGGHMPTASLELNRQDNGRPERLHARPDAPGGDEYRSRSCLTEFMSTDAPARRRQKPISPHREDRRADCPDAPADRAGNLDQRALVLSHKEDRGAVMNRQRAVQRREYIGIIHGKTPSIAPANVAIATSQRNETPCAG